MKDKINYDLHIHTCLSPCGDMDMTPNNIINMSVINNMDVIAITDHNTCKNCEAVMRLGKAVGVKVIPGMELCTAEEIHVICLFPDIDNAMQFSLYVNSRLPNIKNDDKVFGEQIIMDENDNVVSKESKLLLNATDIGIYDVYNMISRYSGLVFPSHIDRSSYSILSCLGALPQDLDIALAELTYKADVKEILRNIPRLNNIGLFFNSDAHRLEQLRECGKPLNVQDNKMKPLIDLINKI